MAQLCQYQEELRQLNTLTLLISFGPKEQAKAWIEDMCPSFELLIDPERNVYHAYKLKHSWFGSWNFKTLAYYIRALVSGRQWHGIVGDSAQLGGDFIIEPNGNLSFEYRSKEATDRPSVSEILALLKRDSG